MLTKKLINYSLCVFCCIFAIVNLCIFLDKTHFAYNLEPYPDALLYALSARTIAVHHQSGLIYKDAHIETWVPQFYSWFLVPFYYISRHPLIFIVANILLSISSFLLFFKVAQNLFKNDEAVFFSLILLFTHAYVWWLPAFALTENMFFLIFVAAVYLVTASSKKSFIFFSTLAVVSVFTRLASVLFSFCIVLWGAYLHKDKFQNITKMVTWILVSFFAGGALLIRFPFFISNTKIFVTEALHGGTFFNTHFIGNNVAFYVRTLFGLPTYFLWLTYPLTSPVIALTACIGIVILIKRRQRALVGVTILFFSLIPLLLLLHAHDARYVYYVIPVFTLICTYLYTFISTKNKKAAYVMAGILILAQIFSQLPLMLEILKTNVFHSSNGWQHIAVSEFDKVLTQKEERTFLITALPPFFVDAYQTGSYTVLPLSEHQEFIAKGQQAWGNEVPLSNLNSTYQQWLLQGKKLYISNAYITHQKSVIDDFEAYKKTFTLKPISEGCYSACNIYELQLRTE